MTEHHKCFNQCPFIPAFRIFFQPHVPQKTNPQPLPPPARIARGVDQRVVQKTAGGKISDRPAIGRECDTVGEEVQKTDCKPAGHRH